MQFPYLTVSQAYQAKAEKFRQRGDAYREQGKEEYAQGCDVKAERNQRAAEFWRVDPQIRKNEMMRKMLDNLYAAG